MTFWTPAPGGPTWGSHPGALQPAMSGFAPAPLSCFSGSKVPTSNPTGLLFKLQLHHRPPTPPQPRVALSPPAKPFDPAHSVAKDICMALMSSGYRSDIFTSSSPALQPAEGKGGGSRVEAQVMGETPTAATALAAPKSSLPWLCCRAGSSGPSKGPGSHLHPKCPGELQVLGIHPSLHQPTASAPLGLWEQLTNTSGPHNKQLWDPGVGKLRQRDPCALQTSSLPSSVHSRLENPPWNWMWSCETLTVRGKSRVTHWHAP